MNIDTKTAKPHDFERDGWGRPKIIQPGGKKVAYTRCTTFIGCLEDTYNLGKWSQRMVAAGLGQRPDLLLRASSLGLQPLDPDAKKRWKKEMDQVTDKAVEAGKASSAATIGTAVHDYTEQIDRGQELGYVPDTYRTHLDAYRAKTAGMVWQHIEQPVVLDDLKIAGTPDRIGTVPGHQKMIIGDVKTGDTDYGILKMCMQEAVYAHSLLYDVATGQRTPIGDVDLERGLIIALSAERASCDIFWIDLAAGWRAVETAGKVREWRAMDRKDKLTEPYVVSPQPQLSIVPDTAVPAQPTTEAGAALVHAIKSARTPDDLVHLWHLGSGRGEWTDTHTHLAAARKAELLKGIPA